MNKEDFLERLQCWIKQDLINMMMVKPLDGCGGCNFPIVLYALSCMEWLGFLLRDCSPNKTQLDKTSENLNSCLDYFPKEYQNSLVREMFKSLFRNGLVHQFGPKFSGISRGNHFNSPVALMQGTFAPVIDADQLANAFIEVIDKVVDEIVLGKIDFGKINEKLKFIFLADRKEYEKLQVNNNEQK